MEKDNYGLEGLEPAQRKRQLNIGAWANGFAALLFLGLFLKSQLRDCISLEKYEEAVNARINDLKAQIEEPVKREAKKQAEKVVLPEIKKVQKDIDTLHRVIDSLQENQGL